MGFSVTIIFYLLIGLGVATAVFLSDSRRSRGSAAFRVATAVVFWPLYLPILLSGPRPGPIAETARDPSDGDAMAQAIAQVETELELALASLDGWVEDVLAHETDCFHELSTAWRAQAERIREMDRLLARAEPATRADARGLGTGGQRPLPPERAVPAGEPRPAPPGSGPRLRRPDGYLGVGPGTGLDDPPGQVHRGARVAGRGAGGPDRHRHRRHLGNHLAGRPARIYRSANSAGFPSDVFPEEILPCDYSAASATSSPRI